MLSKAQPELYTELTRDPEPERPGFLPRTPQLFDLVTDPQERNDLADEHPDRVRRMQAELAAWFEDVEADRRGILDVW